MEDVKRDGNGGAEEQKERSMSAASLTGIHFLLTYRCSAACDHCFVWGSPEQSGVMSADDIDAYLIGASDLGTITSAAIEGGEPFVYYDELLAAVEVCHRHGLPVDVLSNCFWARSEQDAENALVPLVRAGLTKLLTSTDVFHTVYVPSERVDTAIAVAERLGIGTGKMVSRIESVMFRGRAAHALAPKDTREGVAWQECPTCPKEALASPRRVHLDRHGNLHACQGISIGNAASQSIADVARAYDPEAHPIVGALLRGGPTQLARMAMEDGFSPEERYVDACHLCYESRRALRPRHPRELGPDEMYGIAPPQPV